MTAHRVRTGIRPTEAMDAAFAGHACQLLDHAGTARPMALRRWTGVADRTDHTLLLERCHGLTLDVGCGPGRLVEGLSSMDRPALGIDVSAEAIRLARRRGVPAIRRNVFAQLPGEGGWDSALLADGNIGIGGRPERLLRRIGQVLRRGGRVVVELAPDGTGVEHHRLRFRVGDQLTPTFDWAVVGVDAIESIARRARFLVEDIASSGDRHAAVLRRSVG